MGCDWSKRAIEMGGDVGLAMLPDFPDLPILCRNRCRFFADLAGIPRVGRWPHGCWVWWRRG